MPYIELMGLNRKQHSKKTIKCIGLCDRRAGGDNYCHICDIYTDEKKCICCHKFIGEANIHTNTNRSDGMTKKAQKSQHRHGVMEVKCRKKQKGMKRKSTKGKYSR